MQQLFSEWMVVLIISTYAFVVFHQKGGNFSKSLLSLAQPLSYYFSQIKSSRLVSYIFWCVCVQLSQFSSVTQSCLTLCHPVDCIMPGLPVHHQLLELAQTHVLRVSDAIQPSHSLSSLSPPAFNLPWHQGLFQWVSSSHQVAKVLELQLQLHHPINIQDWFPLGLTGWISL